MKLTEQQEKLLDFVKEQHGEQKRKYSEGYRCSKCNSDLVVSYPNDEDMLTMTHTCLDCNSIAEPYFPPYWTHPLTVAELCESIPLGIEIALCHDLFEDTSCTEDLLILKLSEFNYDSHQIQFITKGVIELTDVYTKLLHPDLNREQRKIKEAERLGNIFSTYQSIKLADLIDNCKSIVKHDKNFAPVYLQEIKWNLDAMRKGDIDLYIEACSIYKESLKKLGQ